jgi:2,3-bisphosphoglycerate-dependent phosphoglycerate mutase
LALGNLSHSSTGALIKHLDGISDADIVELNVPTAVPLVYDIDSTTLNPVGAGYYLGDAAEAKAKADAVAAQGKANKL